jgi:thiazole synthase
VKIEVISDQKYLMPDNFETVNAVQILVKEGFIVLPYMSPDLMAARRMADAGAAAIMPLGAPIGTNRGLKTRELVQILISEIDLPIIVDAGLGRPSEAAEAMELGAAAVLVNTAVATAENPILMAEAFALAVEAGRKAYLAGPGATRQVAEASSPLTGFLRDEESAPA